MTSPSVDVSALCHPYIMSQQQSDMLPTILRLNATNETPSAQEEILLRQWQSSFLSPLREVDAAVERVRLQLEQLSERRAAIQMLHDLPKPALSLMRRMPGEILQEIFGFYAKQDTYNNVFGDDRNAGPFKLGHISHKWRSIAHSYTDLWKHTLKLEVKSGAKLRDPLSLLNFVLARLGPLKDVSFDLMGSEQHVVVTSRIVKALLGVFPRWQSAAFRCLPLAVVPLLSTISPPAPRVRELTINVSSNTPRPADVHIAGFSHCFSLAKLDLKGIPFSNISLPCGALRDCSDGTSYDASESPSRALEIMRSCPNLRSFTTSPDHWEILETWNPPPRVTHSSLTSLTTSDAGLLDILNLPALSELVILHPTFDLFAAPLDVLAQIERLVQQSACDLTRLFLVDCDICDGEVVIEELLLSTPNLQHLSFEFTVEISDDESCMTGLVEAMSRRDSILVPKLESLRYFDGSNPEQLRFIDVGFVDMLESRYSVDGHGLKRVNIEFEALHPEDEVTLSGENWARLVVMKRAGLDISISALSGFRFI
ncbi:hypothetical protein BDZ89DRAFT_1071048 [Hymenopellis radicata]|nr:hypothetical protein BDZ89DRAFT_1071048 [Hymenopellis radicata]